MLASAALGQLLTGDYAEVLFDLPPRSRFGCTL